MERRKVVDSDGKTAEKKNAAAKPLEKISSAATCKAGHVYVPKKDLTMKTLRGVLIPDLLIPIAGFVGDGDAALRFVCKLAHASLMSEVSSVTLPIRGSTQGDRSTKARLKAKNYVGSRAMAEWANEVLGMPLNGDTFFAAVRSGDVEAVKWVRTHTDSKVIAAGLLDMRKYKPDNKAYSVGLYGLAHHEKWINISFVSVDWDSIVCTEAARQGHMQLLMWARSQNPPCFWNEDVCKFAAHNGRLDMLEWARSQEPPCPWNALVCSSASKNGHMDVLKWLRSQKPPCPWDTNVCTTAAIRRDWNMLKWARAQKPPCPWSAGVYHNAARHGQLDLIQWGRAQNPACPWNADVTANAAQNGQLGVLKWLRSQNPPCPWDTYVCWYAAQLGHLDMLRWAREQDPPCPWDALVCANAAWKGHLDVLIWLRAQDPPCPWDARVCENAAKGGHLDVLMWARAQEFPASLNSFVLKNAVRYGHLPVLQWLHALNATLLSSAEAGDAALNGHLHVLQWMSKQEFWIGPFVNANICSNAAAAGRLDIIQWAISLNPPCPWHPSTPASAARNGDLEMLKWLRSHRCPWDSNTCHNAAMSGRLDILQWCRSFTPPCPWSENLVLYYAKVAGNTKMIEWLGREFTPSRDLYKEEAEKYAKTPQKEKNPKATRKVSFA